MTTAHPQDINAGLDVEARRRRAHRDAGTAFQHWMRLVDDANASPQDVADARAAYEAAAAAARRVELRAYH